MVQTFAIARRECSSFFLSPIAYLVMAAFMLVAGFFFVLATFRADQPAEMRNLFAILVLILVPVLPAVSMRLMSEELRSGTIEPLMTAPISDRAVILGKWLGAMGFFAVLLLPTLAYLILLEIWADPDYGPIITGYVGLLLVGGLYLAIGLLASALTRNQIIAWMATFFAILVLTVATGAWALPRFLPDDLAEAAIYLNVNTQYAAFAKGLIDLSNLVYFITGIFLFLALAVIALESRKWR